MRHKNPDVEIVNGYEIKPFAKLRRADLEGANLEGANLEGADLAGADLRGANLEGANLEGAHLSGTNLEGANLEGANLEGAHLVSAYLADANFTDSNLRNAEIFSITSSTDANFTNADLTNAKFTNSFFESADFTDTILLGVQIDKWTVLPLTDAVKKYIPKYLRGADLQNADLRGADLSDAVLCNAVLDGANLEGANLEGANLTRANLKNANLKNAKLGGAVLHYSFLNDAHLEGAHLNGARLAYSLLKGTHLEGAHLNGAWLEHAYLDDAHLEDADLTGAKLQYAKLKGAHLEGAHLEDSDLTSVDLRGAHLESADLTGANLNDARLMGAFLEGARLIDAAFRGVYADGADFTNADFSGADIGYTIFENSDLTNAVFVDADYNDSTRFPKDFDMRRISREIRDRRSYGEMTGSVLKLGKPDSPPRAADFKRKYPSEFDRLIKDTGGKDFTDSVKENIRNKYRTPFDWYVTRGKYKSGGQRLSKKPNDVILLNIDLEKLDATTKQIELIKKLANVSRQSEHPYAKEPLFTIGWVRFDTDKEHKTYLVEEVQSDVWVVRQQTKNVDGQTQAQLRQAGIDPADFDEVYEILRPYADRFYEDALGILFLEAEEKGYSVEMLGYGDKKQYGSPRSIYTDLPRKMGMRPQPTQTDLKLQDKVSYYKPNPSRPRRRY
jgi:uncharacterized protein YjbI with pentapeptide repeats